MTAWLAVDWVHWSTYGGLKWAGLRYIGLKGFRVGRSKWAGLRYIGLKGFRVGLVAANLRFSYKFQSAVRA